MNILRVDVDPLPIGGEQPRTRLWITDAAVQKLGRYLAREQPRGAFLKRPDRYSANGFGLYEG